MRHSRLLKTQSSHSICAFCACRLGENPASTQATRRISYAQRRQLNSGRPSNQSNPNAQSQDQSQGELGGVPLSGQSSWGNASVQGDLFGLDQARAALQASKAASRAAEDERRKQILAAADQFESQKMFGNTQEQRSDIQSRNPKEAGRNSNGPFRIRKFEVAQASVQRRTGPKKGPVKEEQSRTKQEHEGPRIKHISGLRSGRDAPSVSASTTPKLETKKSQVQSQLKPKTTVEAPSWVKGGNGDRSAAAISSWGTAPPPPRSAKEKEAADEAIQPPIYQSEEHANTREVPSQNTAEPDTLTTQATASAPLHESQESNIQPRDAAENSPLKFETSSTAPRPSNTDIFGSQDEESRRALIQNMTKKPENVINDQATRRFSDFGDEEEKMFQALLARRSTSNTTAQAEQSGTETFSPMGSLDAEARDALSLQAKERASEERPRGSGNERNEPRQRFRISMSKGNNPSEEAKPFDPEISSKWSIFKHRNQQQDQQDTRHNPAPRAARLSAEDIDARFQEHLRGRPRNRVDIRKISLEDPEPQRSTHARRDDNRKCIRCGELGHIARNCNNAPLPDYQPQTRWTQRHGYNPSIPFDSAESNRAQNVNGADARRVDRNPRIRQGLPVTQQDEPEPSKRATEEAEEDDDGEDDAPAERVLKSRKFADEPVREKERTRNVRRGRRDEEDEDDMPSRGRRGRFMFMEDGEDDGAPRRGRRGLFEEENEGELVYENAREARMERKRARQAKKDKLAKDAAKKAASQARRAEELRRIHLPEFISVSNLAQTLGVRYEDFTEKMEELGFSNTTHDHVLTAENASLIAMEYQFDPIIGETQEMEQDERDLRARPEPDDKEFLPTRPPVVAIMGHVDHGKTTILDFLRKSSVAATEHGGITQHIGAFSVGLSSGKTITFLDTPGHAAFLEMRKRGATVTDIIVLVVAADDSVKPQTIEAIKHAKAANVPIIVAINKIDKEEANIERVKQDLARHEVEIEDFGGDTQVVCVSGKTGEGIDQLEDAAVTLSEILDHRAETDGPVEGWVLEATTKKAGRVATVLVKRGTLSPGNIIVAGKTWTRVRSLRNEAGVMIKSAGPGTPIEVDGWKDQPKAGDEVLQAPNEQKASDVVSYREELDERTKMAEDMEAINESRRLETEKRELEREALKLAASSSAQGDEDVAAAAAPKAQRDTEVTLGHQTVPFIVKADVSGSVEAVNAYLLQMSNPLCSPTLLRSGVGPVGEFDVEHAAAAGGHIISFNLPASPETAGMAESKGVKVLEQNVIYRIVEQVRTVLEEKLPPVKTQRVLGEAEVAVAFEIGLGGRRKMRIAGCKVRNGVMGRGSRVRILRGGEKVYDGVVSSLKNVKKDVQEMRKGTECGMGFDDWESFEVGDQIQTYEEKVEKRSLQI